MAENNDIRLHLVLARAGVCSRRAGEELIRQKRVSVDGEVISTPGFRVNPHKAAIRVDGRLVIAQDEKIFVFHKPPNVITSLRDPQGRPSVGEYVRGLPVRVFPVGRLDFDVSGLLLLTNAGEYADRLLHPRYGQIRRYLAVVRGQPSRATLCRLERGVELADGLAAARRVRRLTSSREVSRFLPPPTPDESTVEIEVTEGRKHFVKNLLDAVEHPVTALCRVSFGPFQLGDLPRGAIRETTFLALKQNVERA